jgi:hypothetical protein
MLTQIHLSIPRPLLIAAAMALAGQAAGQSPPPAAAPTIAFDGRYMGVSAQSEGGAARRYEGPTKAARISVRRRR